MTGAAKITIKEWLEKYTAEQVIEVLYEEGLRMRKDEWSGTEEEWIKDISFWLRSRRGA